MTVQQKTYTDQTGALMQYFNGLIGKSGTIQGDPYATDALRQILGTQLGQLTPEGLAGIIKQIFEQGGKAVPQIATQYGQAAGARISNNSGIKLANANLQNELARKSFDMILQAQNNAANTAGILGKLNTTTKEGSANPWMQALLPFAPSILGKMKFLKDDPTEALGGSQTTGVFGSNSGVGTGYGFSTSDFSGGGYSSVDYGGFDIGDAGYFGADTGGDYGMGFGSDGIDLGGFDVGDSSFDFGTGADYGNLDLGAFFADGGLVSKKRMGTASKKPRGYAEGGRITSVGGVPNDVTDVTGRPIRGVTYTGSGSQSLVPLLASMNGGGADNSGRNFEAPKDKDVDDFSFDGGPGISVPSVVGTPQENAAAIAGIVGMAVSTALGIPAAVPGLAMSALGIPNSSMSPVGKGLSFAMSLISQALNSNNNDDSIAPPTEGGMSTVGPTGAGMSTIGGLNNNSAMSIGLDAISSPVDGIAEGLGTDAGSVGGSSSGGTDGVGDAAAAGVGGGGFKKGGEVDGPGTGTSDSIPIHVSDGEYVLNAEATNMFLPVIEMMNALGLQQRGGAKNGAR